MKEGAPWVAGETLISWLGRVGQREGIEGSGSNIGQVEIQTVGIGGRIQRSNSDYLDRAGKHAGSL
jgi:hypothetical protein